MPKTTQLTLSLVSRPGTLAALEVAKGDCELRGKPTRHDLGEGAAEPILVLVDPAAPFHDLRTYFRTVRPFTS